MADKDESESSLIDGAANARRFETTQRLDPDAFNHAKSRLDGGFEWGVEALLIDGAGRVLLVCEDGRWALPGGEVAADQSHEAALKGAVEMATGVEITVGELLAINDVTLTDGDRDASLSFGIYDGEVTAGSGDPEPGQTSISAVEWHAELPPATIERALLSALLG